MASIHLLNFKLIASQRHMKIRDAHIQRLLPFAIAEQLDIYVNNKMEFFMAKGKKKADARQSWMVDFAALKLNAEQKKAFQGWVKEQQAHEIDPLFELVPNGWKLSVSFDAENDCYIVSLTQRDEDDINHNICVVSRSGDPYEALWIGFYKISVMADGKKLPTEAVDDNWG
jgi:hypothetical protein